jgi:hypothetical protein
MAGYEPYPLAAADRVDDAVIAVNELAANAVHHK